MSALRILIGIVLLLFGRKLFWLFVAGIGLIVAMDLVIPLFPESAILVAVVVGLVAGVIGALLAIFLQRVAVGVAGFLAGWSIILSLLDTFSLGQMAIPAWVFAIVGGVVGLIVALTLLDWALIVLSSLSGAGLIAQSIDLNRPLTVLVFVLAVVVGIVVQARTLRRESY